ncbi:hypothetical protein PGUG_01664 [Meyerozyma guilliermondii ATCC 6260]|uniref:Uncharacterized protein n=1 Tax=Meyerozyma guilliermondii (strain ATCC 6260 / CBS 566 / DSM 6381 / JCM 1539 / NBRC 10279 / NRRL Y-324) TaxID=294746 RepID=A5DEG3_PICGU|nr:uncharacterized protein PGUG_01664 [Meyerozyma guilliermondii ATCC 6260]EDK37566.2 hypothetical protein PGUG_01664 [Meyerozyma guilliermondii ATCC 6260]
MSCVLGTEIILQLNMSNEVEWKPLNVIVLGGGIGGLACAVAMRRAAHQVTVYERSDFCGEVGAAISCASNGGKWLHEWGIDMEKTKPVILKSLIKHRWNDGEVFETLAFDGYEKHFGVPYYNFHRKDIHSSLYDAATNVNRDGTPAQIVLNHEAVEIDYETCSVTFENGKTVSGDIILAADGIRSRTKPQLGITPVFEKADSSCIRVLYDSEKAKQLGLLDFASNDAIEFWGTNENKIVMSPCENGRTVCCLCFYKCSEKSYNTFNRKVSLERLLEVLPDLDPQLCQIFKECGYEIKEWGLYIHEPLPYFFKASKSGKKGVALVGDAAHPMMPDQAQGAVSAIEDAGCLGEVFSKEHDLSVEESLMIYESVRKERVTKIQDASLRARRNLNERMGWNKDLANPHKLSLVEVCGYDMKDHIKQAVKSIKQKQFVTYSAEQFVHILS